MSPTLLDGNYVVAWRSSRYKVGQLAIFDHPRLGRCVKRILRIDPDRGVELAGDNPNSTSHEELGWQPIEALNGRVLFTVKP